MAAPYPPHPDRDTERVVRVPRPADPLGAALRGVFGAEALPSDWQRLLARLDRST